MIFTKNRQRSLISGNGSSAPKIELRLWRNRKLLRKLSENYGEHPEESTGVFDRPADKIAGFRQKNNSP